jgi:hypothetical protein
MFMDKSPKGSLSERQSIDADTIHRLVDEQKDVIKMITHDSSGQPNKKLSPTVVYVTQNRIREVSLIGKGVTPDQIFKDLEYDKSRLAIFRKKEESKTRSRLESIDMYGNPSKILDQKESITGQDEDVKLEALVGGFFADRDWLGDSSYHGEDYSVANRATSEAKLSSLNDDIGHGTDVIVTFDNKLTGQKILALDTTLIYDPKKLAEKKFAAVAHDKKLPRGWTHLSYVYASEPYELTGPARYVPRIIIGATTSKKTKYGDNVDLFDVLCVQDDADNIPNGKTKQQKQELKLAELGMKRQDLHKWEAEVRLKVIIEMHTQVRYLSQYAREHGLQGSYDERLEKLEEYLAQSEKKARLTYEGFGGNSAISNLRKGDVRFAAVMDASEALLSPRDQNVALTSGRKAVASEVRVVVKSPLKIYEGQLPKEKEMKGARDDELEAKAS